MPYYIYRVMPFAGLEKVDQFTLFSEASRTAKLLRAAPDLPDGSKIKVIFAANELAAEDLLGQVREPQAGIVGDE